MGPGAGSGDIMSKVSRWPNAPPPVYLGFTYAFGGKGKQRDPGFEFAPAGGPPGG